MTFPSDSKWGMSSFIKFAKAAELEGFPEVVDVNDGFQVNVQSKDSAVTPEVIPVSRRIQTWNADRNQLWQASAEMYAANRRAPYLGWEKFRPHILKGWNSYAKIAKPKKASQMTLHYVNEIAFSDSEPPSDFVRLVPPDIRYADNKSNFNCTVIETFRSGDIIQVSSGRNPNSPNLAISLNIIYVKKAPSLEQSALAEQIESSHRRIIDAYEKTITDKQRERMEPV